jgi:hypothetical protein
MLTTTPPKPQDARYVCEKDLRNIYDALQCNISISRLEILVDVLTYSCVKTSTV